MKEALLIGNLYILFLAMMFIFTTVVFGAVFENWRKIKMFFHALIKCSVKKHRHI